MEYNYCEIFEMAICENIDAAVTWKDFLVAVKERNQSVATNSKWEPLRKIYYIKANSILECCGVAWQLGIREEKCFQIFPSEVNVLIQDLEEKERKRIYILGKKNPVLMTNE